MINAIKALLQMQNGFLQLESTLLAVHTRFVGCLPLKNLLLIAFINFCNS
jgi:hypothetical protein